MDAVQQLNNKGISLLQGQHFRAARQAFQDAVEVAGAGQGTSHCSECQGPQSEALPTALPLQFSVIDIQLITSASSTSAIFNLLGEYSDDSFALISLQSPHVLSRKYATRMAEAVVLYNCAIARQSHARALEHRNRPMAATVQHQAAARLLERADGILEKLCLSSMAVEKSLHEDNAIREILLVHFFVLLALYGLKSNKAQVVQALHGKLASINVHIEALSCSCVQQDQSPTVPRATAA